MSGVLTASSTMFCPHGGTVIATPGSSSGKAGAPILRSSDSFTVAGCAFAPASVASPCVTVQWTTTATRVQDTNNPVLTESSVGLCLAATQAPQGPVQIAATQAKVTAL